MEQMPAKRSKPPTAAKISGHPPLHCPQSRGCGSLSDSRRWYGGYTQQCLSLIHILEEHLLKKMPDNTAKAALRQCLSSPENTFRSILITASSFFGMFNQNPKLAAMLSHSTFTLGAVSYTHLILFLHVSILRVKCAPVSAHHCETSSARTAP